MAAVALWLAAPALLGAPAVDGEETPPGAPSVEAAAQEAPPHPTSPSQPAEPPSTQPAPAASSEPPDVDERDAGKARPMPPSESSITASRPTTDTLLSSLGPGTGPGLPWQVVLVAQLVAYMVADVPAYIGCVLGSWVLSLLVPLGPGVLVALGLSVILIPGAAILSGCASAALLQWLGDRLGTLRGRLACVGMTSVTLSFVTYAFVIAPILLGMGFFAVALTTFLSAFLVLPFVQPDASDFAPQWLVRIAPFLAYSLSAAGALGAIVVMALGAVLAPTVGFVVRPILMALVYRLTGRDRQAGEEQWPPSLFGERSDLWWPWRRAPDRPVSPELPSLPAPAPPPSTPSEHMQY